LTLADPGVVVFDAVDNDSLPIEFVDLDARALDRDDVANEVAGQLEAGRISLAYA